MSKSKPDFMLHEDFKAMQRSIVLLQGCFDKSFFQQLKDRKEEKFFILEGRPGLKAAQSNCSQLNKIGITPTLICDNMAGFLFAKDLVKEVRIAYVHKDDETLTVSIGGSILGVLAMRHGVSVHAYPSDEKLKPVADGNELLMFKGKLVAPKTAKAYVPLVEQLERKYVAHVIEP
jgi:methylthioribose-1-phosphate isomerase